MVRVWRCDYGIASCWLIAATSFFMMIFGILEKVRWTPFYEEMKCNTPPVPIRFSSMRVPAPNNVALGVPAATEPPFGLYTDMTLVTYCENPNQAKVTIKKQGSSTELFLPDLVDLQNGGPGLPNIKLASGVFERDAVFAPDGGRDQIVSVNAIGLTMTDIMGLIAAAGKTGYVPMYVKSIVTVETVSMFFGTPTVTEETREEWCGYWGGNCMAEIVGSSPPQLEPALCQLTLSWCAKTEAEMKAALDFAAQGGTVVGTMPCAPNAGQPQGTQCNIVSSPGVDPTTFTPRELDPARKNLPAAQSEIDEEIDEAESMVHGMLSAAIAGSALLSVLGIVTSFLLRRRIPQRWVLLCLGRCGFFQPGATPARNTASDPGVA